MHNSKERQDIKKISMDLNSSHHAVSNGIILSIRNEAEEKSEGGFHQPPRWALTSADLAWASEG